MKFKEFFARYQFSLEGRQQMGEQQQKNLEQKYLESGAKQYGYSFQDFKKIRSEQIYQLHNAYEELAHGKYNRLMGPRDVNDTSEEALRRVTGKNGLYNTNFIALDSDDRKIISQISVECFKKNIFQGITSYETELVLNGVEALHSISNSHLEKPTSIMQILRETDVFQTEMAKANQAYNFGTYEKYAQYNPPQKGFLAKVIKAIQKLKDPEKYAEQQKRFDEQDVPGLE